MPAKSARTPSRGRPPKRSGGASSAGRSQSASRRSRSAASKAFKQIHQQQQKRPPKEAKSPAKTPKPTKTKRKETPSRKVATAPAAYSAASKRARSRGSISPTRAPRPVTTTTVSSVRGIGANSYGTPHVSALGVSTTTGGRTSRGSLSPPALRSRTFAQHVAQQHAQLMRQIDAQQKSPKAKAAKQKPWPIVQAVRDAPSALSHQFSKLGRNRNTSAPQLEVLVAAVGGCVAGRTVVQVPAGSDCQRAADQQTDGGLHRGTVRAEAPHLRVSPKENNGKRQWKPWRRPASSTSSNNPHPIPKIPNFLLPRPPPRQAPPEACPEPRSLKTYDFLFPIFRIFFLLSFLYLGLRKFHYG